MTDEPLRHNRRSIRLQGYDYSLAGAYFITICTHNRVLLLGEIAAGEVRLNQFGVIVQRQWLSLPRHHPGVELDVYCIMPNHLHGILVLAENELSHATPRPAKHQGLTEIVRGFKSFSARQINTVRGTPGTPVWQRTFYERIIRNEWDWDQIRMYIENNPLEWSRDEENPAGIQNL